MPHLKTDDGIKLYYEEAGTGTPVIFVHEFAGDVRSWEPQVREFARMYRCIAFNARGYPPSDVPGELKYYSQERARDDIRAVLDALEIDKAHVVGLSMGGFATLHFGLAYPERARSIVVAGCGYGAAPDTRKEFADQLAQHSTQGSVLTLRGVQKMRPSLYDLTDKMRALRVPTLVMTGDEDWPCLEPGLLMKRNISSAAVVV